MSSERVQRRIERLLGQAKEAAERSDWEESRRLTDDILALDPENADAQAYIVSELQLKIESLLIQAQAAAEQSDWSQSRQSAELVLAMDPDNAIARSYVLRAGQGTIEHLLDQIEEAADRRDWDQVRLIARDILALDPDNVDAQAYNAAADRVVDNISDESQRGHYEIVVDSSTGVATVRGDKVDFLPIGQRTRYQRQEFAVLEVLYRSRGRALSLQQIADECSSVFYFDLPLRAKDTIETCIISLRARIEKDPSNPTIIRDVGDRSAASSGRPDKYMIAPSFVQTATVLDTGDISLPKLPEETNQELDQVTPVEPSEEERTTGGQTTPDKKPPLKQTSREAAEEKPTRPIGQGGSTYPSTHPYRRRSEGAIPGAPARVTRIDPSRWRPEVNPSRRRPEVNRKSQTPSEGFNMVQIVKRVLLIAVVGFIFGMVGQFIAIFIFGLTYDEGSWAFILIGYITGGIIGNKLYDQGVG